jgi:hypothetical protein
VQCNQYIYYLHLRPSICTTTSAPCSLPKLVTTIVLQEYSSAVSLSIIEHSQQCQYRTKNKAEEIISFSISISISIYIFHPLEFPPACCQLLPASSFSSPACIAANPLLPFNFRFRFRFHFTSTIHNPPHPPRPSVRWLLHAFTAPLKGSILLVLPRAVTVVHTVMTQHRQGSGKVSISKDATR